MVRWVRGLMRALGALAAALCLVVLVVGAAYGVKGYSMYRRAVEAWPMEEMAASIRNEEDFTAYEDLPQLYVDAVISVEDQRFWSHPGVDVLAIARAAWNDLKTLSLAEGGSTISQQLMKNEYFTQQKQLERKAAEAFAALELESRFDKQEIFELYVNTIYFGSGYEGIAEAAQGYFNKQPSQLDEVECVLLAGIPNAPSAYSLDVNPDLALQRMGQVLERMEDCGKMTQEQASDLLAQAQQRIEAK